MKLKDYLDKYSVNKAAFAKKIGIAPLTLHQILKGRNMPNLRTALLIEEATRGEVACRDLLDEDQGKKK